MNLFCGKLILSLSISLLPICLMAQHSLPDTIEQIFLTDEIIAKPGDVYIDDLEVNLSQTYFCSSNVENIVSRKGESAKLYSGARAAVLIKRKVKYEFELLTDIVSEVRKEFGKLEQFDVFIDNKNVECIEHVLVENSPDVTLVVVENNNANRVSSTGYEIRIYVNEQP